MPTASEYLEWRSSRKVPAPPSTGPVMSVVVLVSSPKAEYLAESIRSVGRQSYARWELLLADVSDEPHVRPLCDRFRQLDGRIRTIDCRGGNVAGGTNAAVSTAQGSWLVLLGEEDLMEDHALAVLAARVVETLTADFIYSDEDQVVGNGNCRAPFFKPDWSPDLLRCVDYIGPFVACRRQLFDDVGGLRSDHEGAERYDFVLRATAQAREVQHVADVLYHRRTETHADHAVVAAHETRHAASRALEDFARRTDPGCVVEVPAGPEPNRLRYPLRREMISIVVPFRDRPTLTDACLRSIERFGSSLPFELLLVSNRSTERSTFEAMEHWTRRWTWARALCFDEPFNFQRLNNWATEQAKGSYLLFLNNDTEAVHGGWVEALAEHAQRPSVGAVGARLFYPDGLIQHAGVVVGIGGFADHPWAHLSPDASTPAGPSSWVRDMTAVTAACLMVNRARFEGVGGFDERFSVCGGDVDLCIRLVDAGYWNIVTPYARLVHREAATRERQPPAVDVEQSLRAYARYLNDGGDPFYNPNLTLLDTSCGLGKSA